jgi:hypothetical protein
MTEDDVPVQEMFEHALTVDQAIERLQAIKNAGGGALPLHYCSNYDWTLPVTKINVYDGDQNWDDNPETGLWVGVNG